MKKICENSIICDGDYAIVQKIGGVQLRLCRLLCGQRALIEKLHFDPTDAIGKPFGIFEVGANGKKLIESDSSQNSSFSATCQIECDDLKAMQDEINSKNSPATEQKQLMTANDIEILKSEGISTEKLVSKLVNGNSSFKNRSQFSKEKYLRKMTKKHSDKVMLSRPNIRLICQSYFNKDPERISHLRLDQLGLLLQLSAIHSCGCNIFVYENTLGLLGSAVMERLNNQGNCIFLHRGDWPQSIPCIDAMNNRNQENFLPLRITTLLQPDLLKDEEESNQQKTERRQFITSHELQKNNMHSTIDNDCIIGNEESSSMQNLIERRSQRREKEKRALELLSKTFTDKEEEMAEEGKLDGILLAGRTFDTVDVLKRIISGLRLSGSVVIYSPIKQHLLKAWSFLRSTNSFIDIQIQSQFCRSLQILPNQTHPLMQQPVTGGYILSATKILAIEKFRKLKKGD